MTVKKAKAKKTSVVKIKCHLLGLTPFIMHRFPAKTWLPIDPAMGRRPSNPLRDYQESFYLNKK